MKKALLVGASGYVGRFLLDELLNSNKYEKVTIVVRRDLGISHPKLKTLLGDYSTFASLKDEIEVDDVFITLGSTRKKTPDLKKYYEIDHDYPVLISQIAKEKGAKSVLLLTAVGSNVNSSMFYVRTKGEVERDVIAQNFDYTHIFRPSMILGDRKEFRLMEKMFLGIWPLVDGLLGLMGASKYKGIKGELIAKAMTNAAQKETSKVAFYEYDQMMALVDEKPVSGNEQ